MKQTYFTIGEIFRLGLLKTFDGQPYKHKASISNIVAKLSTKSLQTKWGLAKTLSEEQIEEFNNKWRE